MTQEELDALMEEEVGKDESGDKEILEDVDEDIKELIEEGEEELKADETESSIESEEDNQQAEVEEFIEETEDMDETLTQEDSSDVELTDDKSAEHYRADAATTWPPPPPDDDHKVVNQLDDVARDSEKKAGEIFDKLEEINNIAYNIENSSKEQVEIIERNIDIFERLSSKFSDIESFSKALEDNKKALDRVNETIRNSQEMVDSVMMAMDTMQYQDIHRQKIERVINVMRTLAHYMHSLFDSPIDDKDRATTAVTISGDSSEVMSENDIEALLESFGKK
jgi:methyl-accepting chemotaxis protein